MLRNRLKTATRAPHERAEARWTSGGQFMSRAAYDGWLERMGRIHDGLGRDAARVAGWPPGAGLEAARSRALAADLGAGVSHSSTPGPLSQAAGWGVLYALNGSALGARALLRNGLGTVDWPQAYLDEMAGFAQSGALAGFFEALEASDMAPGAALSGALLVFDAIAAERFGEGQLRARIA